MHDMCMGNTISASHSFYQSKYRLTLSGRQLKFHSIRRLFHSSGLGCLMSSSPLEYIVKVPAFMQGVEIRVRPTVIFDPIEC